jgi:hypothetical protein
LYGRFRCKPQFHARIAIVGKRPEAAITWHVFWHWPSDLVTIATYRSGDSGREARAIASIEILRLGLVEHNLIRPDACLILSLRRGICKA